MTGFAVRLMASLGGLGAFAYWVQDGRLVGPVLAPVQAWVAEVVRLALSGVGIEAVRRGSALYHEGGFAVEISHGCLGLLPAGCLAVAILAYPAGARAKWIGLLLGVPFVLGVNLIRLVHLFYLGVRHLEAFHFAHLYAWQGGLVLTVLCAWMGWVWLMAGGGFSGSSGWIDMPSAAA